MLTTILLRSGPGSKAGKQDAFSNCAPCRINTGDVILLSLREFQDGKGDVILKYSSEEARNLKAYGMSNLHVVVMVL